MNVTVTLVTGSGREARVKARLEGPLTRYDLTRWRLTNWVQVRTGPSPAGVVGPAYRPGPGCSLAR